MKIIYTEELIASVNKYNDNLDEIAKRILNLKIDLNEKDIEIKNLWRLSDNLSVINSAKSRKAIEELLKVIINEYSYMLEVYRDTGELP